MVRYPSIIVWVSLTLLSLVLLGAMQLLFEAPRDLQSVSSDWSGQEGFESTSPVELPLLIDQIETDPSHLRIERDWVLERDRSNLALLVEDPHYRVDVYWDGQWIGGSWSSGKDTSMNPPGEHVLAVIPEALSRDGTHRITVDMYGDDGLVGLDGRIFIGSLMAAEQEVRRHYLSELISPIIMFALAICAFILFLFSRHRLSLFWLGMMCACAFSIGVVEGAHWWLFSDDLGLRNHLSLITRTVLPVTALCMYVWFAEERYCRLDRVLIGLSVSVTVLAILSPVVNIRLVTVEGVAGLIAGLICLRVLWLMWRLLSTRRVDVYLMILGLIVGALALSSDLVYVFAGYGGRQLTPIFAVGMHLVTLVALLFRVSEESNRYRQLVESAEDSLLVLDTGGRIWEANPAAERLLRSWQPGDSFLDRISPDYRVRGAAHLEGDRSGRRIEIKIPTSQGDLVYESLAVNLPNERVSLTLRDISARRSMEAGMLHSARMETVGALASGIAHDFNNTMTALLGQVGILQIQGDDSKRGSLKKMESIILSASRMMQRLMAVARGSVDSHEILNISEVIREMEELMVPLLPSSIQLHVSVPSHSIGVMGSASDLEQVILNLVVNARDSLGRLSGNIWLELRDGDSVDSPVEIIVEDDGPGIRNEIRDEIWRPFYTTKSDGRGSGLGLSVIARVIRDHGGSVVLDAPVQADGARFRVSLPRLENERLEEADLPLDGVVVLVEDEPEIRRVIEQIIRGIGCRVISFPDAEQALVYAQGCRVDLLVTDAVLPGLSGIDLADKLVGLQPKLQVMVISAYLPQNAARLDSSWHCISKPFSRSRIERAVRRALLAGR